MPLKKRPKNWRQYWHHNRNPVKHNYGVLPALCCTIYEDLQKSAAVDNGLTPPMIMRLIGSHTNLSGI
jgi:hypothetical protein